MTDNMQTRVFCLLLLAVIIQAPILLVCAQESRTVVVKVVDSSTGNPVNGASVFLEIPSKVEKDSSCWYANYANLLPIIIQGNTNQDGYLFTSFNSDANIFFSSAQVNCAEEEYIISDFFVEHEDYEPLEGNNNININDMRVEGAQLEIHFELNALAPEPEPDQGGIPGFPLASIVLALAILSLLLKYRLCTPILWR